MEILHDYELVGQVANGDNGAFIKLYDQYTISIHAFVLHMLQDSTLAEEVTQDTFLKLWNHAGQYLTDRGSVQTWLLAIARNTALDCLRRESRRPKLMDEYDPDDLLQAIPDEKSLVEETRWRSLHFAVLALPNEQRHIIDLVYYQGLTQSEISKTMDWPLGTVKTRLRSAMRNLRQAWVDD